MRRFDRWTQPGRRRRRRLEITLPPVNALPPTAEDTQFEVQQRSPGGPIRRMFFGREADALSFADALAHWMARRGEDGSVRIVWPATHADPGA